MPEDHMHLEKNEGKIRKKLPAYTTLKILNSFFSRLNPFSVHCLLSSWQSGANVNSFAIKYERVVLCQDYCECTCNNMKENLGLLEKAQQQVET